MSQVNAKWPRFIYIAGADGTGKSTQAKLLIEFLESQGIRCRHLWLRFPFLFVVPLLGYARWRKYSWHEFIDGVDYGYWDFSSSWILGAFLPWLLLLDAALVSIFRVYIPLGLGEVIVCERFVLDMLVDMAVAFDDINLHQRLPGRLYQRLIPHDARVIILGLDTVTVRLRRPSLQADRRLEDRLKVFARLAETLFLPVVSSEASVTDVAQRIREVIYLGVVDE